MSSVCDKHAFSASLRKPYIVVKGSAPVCHSASKGSGYDRLPTRGYSTYSVSGSGRTCHYGGQGWGKSKRQLQKEQHCKGQDT